MKKAIFYFLRYLWLILGLLVLSISIVLLIQAGLGPMPWDVFHLGVANHLFFTLGQVMIGTGVLLIGLSWVLGVKPHWGSILNMILIGVFVDLIMHWGWFPVSPHLWYRVACFVTGVVLCGLGTGMYISANLGSGPRDSMMLALSRKTGCRVGTVRTAMEVAVVVMGIILGGSFGIGTLVFSLTIGWSTEFFLVFFQKMAERPALKNVKYYWYGPLSGQKNISPHY